MTTTPCPTCKKLDHEVNHPVGMIFVGWGRGWETCTTCLGRGVVMPPETPCGRCGATRGEMFMTSVPSCVNREACALRVKLRDLRAAVLAIADRLDETNTTGAARELREACKVGT